MRTVFLVVCSLACVVISGRRLSFDQSSLLERHARGEVVIKMSDFFKAVKEGNDIYVWTYINMGVDPNRPDTNGKRALDYVLESKNGHMIRLLLEKGADPRKSSMSLPQVAEIGSPPGVKFLIEKGTDPNEADPATGKTALYFAAQKGYGEMIKSLLLHGSDVTKTDKLGTPPLLLAAENGASSIIDTMLDPKLNGGKNEKDLVNQADNDGWTPLLSAAGNGWTPIAERLLKAGADPNKGLISDGRTPLLSAAGRDHKEVVKLLLKYGAKKDLADKDGVTAIELARKRNLVEMVKLLEEQ